MPEKLTKIEQKIELSVKLLEGSKKLLSVLKSFIISLLVTIGTIYAVISYGIENKETLTEKILPQSINSLIHKEVIEESKHYAGSKLREKDSLYIAEIKRKADKAYSRAAGNYQILVNLEERVSLIESLIPALEKRGDYNTKGLKNVVEAICEQMESINGCNINYYKSHTKDNWVKIPNDAYGISMLYPFNTRSNCRGYYTDINTGSIIEIP